MRFKLYDWESMGGWEFAPTRFTLQLLDDRGCVVKNDDISEDEWLFERRRGRLLAMLRARRQKLKAPPPKPAIQLSLLASS